MGVIRGPDSLASGFVIAVVVGTQCISFLAGAVVAYALFLLTVLVIGVGLWVCAVRTGVQRRIAK